MIYIQVIVKPYSEVLSSKVKTKRTWADTKITSQLGTRKECSGKQVVQNSCELLGQSSVHVSSWNYMQAQGTAFKLM